MKDLSSEQLARMKLPDLRGLAQEIGLIGYSRLRKQDLVEYLLRQMRADERARAAASERRETPRPSAAKIHAGPVSESPASIMPEAAQDAGDEPRAADAPEDDPGSMRDAAWYPPELPETYGRDRLTLMVRDPHWLFCYWELTDSLLALARVELGESSWRVLRVHLLGAADEVLDGWEHGLGEEAVSWYVRTDRPGARFRAELGLRDAAGRYRVLVASEAVTAPLDTPSERWDEEWVGLSRDSWEELARAARPYPASMSGSESIKRELRSVASARIGSEGFSPSSPRKARKASSAR